MEKNPDESEQTNKNPDIFQQKTAKIKARKSTKTKGEVKSLRSQPAIVIAFQIEKRVPSGFDQ